MSYELFAPYQKMMLYGLLQALKDYDSNKEWFDSEEYDMYMESAGLDNKIKKKFILGLANKRKKINSMLAAFDKGQEEGLWNT
jgi:hypothetical protein